MNNINNSNFQNIIDAAKRHPIVAICLSILPILIGAGSFISWFFSTSNDFDDWYDKHFKKKPSSLEEIVSVPNKMKSLESCLIPITFYEGKPKHSGEIIKHDTEKPKSQKASKSSNIQMATPKSSQKEIRRKQSKNVISPNLQARQTLRSNSIEEITQDSKVQRKEDYRKEPTLEKQIIQAKEKENNVSTKLEKPLTNVATSEIEEQQETSEKPKKLNTPSTIHTNEKNPIIRNCKTGNDVVHLLDPLYTRDKLNAIIMLYRKKKLCTMSPQEIHRILEELYPSQRATALEILSNVD